MTRLYSQDIIGEWQIWLTVVNLLTPIAFWRSDISIQRAPNLEAARGSWVAGIRLTLILAPCLGVISFPLLRILEVREPQVAAAFLVATVAGVSLTQLTVALLLHQSRYSKAGSLAFMQSAAGASVPILFGFQWALLPALLAGTTVGRALAPAFACRAIRRELRGQRDNVALGRTAIRNGPDLVSNVLNQLSLSLPLLLLPVVMTIHDYASYALSWRVALAPLTLVGLGAAQLWLAEFGRSYREDKSAALSQLRKYLAWTSILSVVIVLPVVMGVAALSEPIFGDQWTSLGFMLAWMAPVGVVQLVASPIGQTLLVARRRGVQLTFDVARLAWTAGVILALWVLNADVRVVVPTISIFLIISYVAYILVVLATLGGRYAKS